MLQNPKQKSLRDAALAKLDAARKLKPRKRNYAKRKVKSVQPEDEMLVPHQSWTQILVVFVFSPQMVKSGDVATGSVVSGACAASKKGDKPTCRHFFSEKGCHRGDKCRFSHVA